MDTLQVSLCNQTTDVTCTYCPADGVGQAAVLQLSKLLESPAQGRPPF